MSKPKPKPKKNGKILVRNASVPVRTKRREEKPQKLKKVHFSEDKVEYEIQNKDFAAPEFCTLLQLAEEVKKIRDWRKTVHDFRDSNGPVKYRNLNFLPQEKIYQDLVELDAPEEGKSHHCPRPLSKKDPELDYNKYLKYELEPEYYFPAYTVLPVCEPKPSFVGFSIYNKINMWKKKNLNVFDV